MGYAQYTITRRGQQIEAGYAVDAECEQPNCPTQTNRSLDALCGESPGGDEYGCGGYFCPQHLHVAPDGEIGYLCGACYPETDDDGNRIAEVGS